MEQRILHLTLNRHWFNQIAYEGKREEYRAVKSYWVQRLALCKGTPPKQDDYFCKKATCHACLTRGNGFRPREYDLVIAKNGYGPNVAELRFIPGEISIGKPNPEWIGYDERDETLFIIPIKELISVTPAK